MSQHLQSLQRSHSLNSEDSQSKKLESFMLQLQLLCQQEPFKEAAKATKEMADMQAKLRQQEDRIHGLEKDLQNEREVSDSNVKELQTYFAKTITESHCQEMKTKDRQVAEARKDLEAAKSQAAKSLENEKSQTAKCEKAEAELTDAENRLETQRKYLDQAHKEAKDLRNKEQDQDNQIQRNKDRIAQLEGHIKGLENDNEKFKQYQSELQKLQAFSADLVDDDISQVKRRFNSLWAEYYNAVRNAFNADLSESVLTSLAWKNLTQLNQTTYATPVPRSNTPAAKFMRTMVVLAFISSQLVSTIFTTSHLVEGDAALRANRLSLVEEDPHKEAFLRGMLATLPDGQESQVHVSRLVTEVRSVVSDLLAPGTANRLFTDLERITKEAASFGRSLRTRQSCFEIDVEVTDDIDWDWGSISLPDTGSTLPDRRVTIADFRADPAELVVFPRVFTVGPEEDALIVPGKVLQRSATEAARQELAAVSEQISRSAFTRHARTRGATTHSTNHARHSKDSFLDSRNGSNG